MAHHTLRSGYGELVERLNRFPQGAPPSQLLYQILAMLFSEREAGLVAQLPIRPVTVELAARLWRCPAAEAEALLDELAGRAILLDVERDGVRTFLLPPPMAGFFEFSLMRVRSDLDQKLLAELFYEYMNVEEDFVKALFTHGTTRIGRTFVNEEALGPEASLEVLDFERASEVARSASHIAVGLCYCRHKMQHMGRACAMPLEICLTFNNAAASLTRHGHARSIESAECLDLLAQASDLGLVHFGENVRQKVAFICNCCACCCEAMIAARRFGHLHPVQTTAFLPRTDDQACSGCGACVNVCPVEAMTLVSANDPGRPRRRQARLDPQLCLGCGLCVNACPDHNIVLELRGERQLTPLNAVHRAVLMALERGGLEHLVFDRQVLASHRIMAAVLGAILSLPPAKKLLAGEQLRSRYLEALVERYG